MEKRSTKPKKSNMVTDLVQLATRERLNLFHTPSRTYGTFQSNGHRETWPVRSTYFQAWLASRYFQRLKSVPNRRAVESAIDMLHGQALYDGPEREVHLRVACHDDKVYVDLSNEKWETVEITPHGWKLMKNPPVQFRRTSGMLALPHPVSGGSLSELREFINIRSQDDFILVMAWLVASLRAQGPYPILILNGEQGSGKSMITRALRSLVDPNFAPLRAEPKNLQDVMIAAENAHVISFDNLSALPGWLSDAFCRLSTGGGFSTRELYSDSNEVLINVQRPLILNGIEEFASRGDLLDRAILLDLPQIPAEKRCCEEELWQRFEQCRPRLFGALLTALSGALAVLPSVKLDRLPRMAGFAVLGTAMERGMGLPDGAFVSAYEANQSAIKALGLDASPVINPILKLMPAGFRGTASDLYNRLEKATDSGLTRHAAWPRTPQALAGHVRRIAPVLTAARVDVVFEREPSHDRRRIITIKRCDPVAEKEEP